MAICCSVVCGINEVVNLRVTSSSFTFIIVTPQLIPGIDFTQKHLGFVWGPGDILVYETKYKATGSCQPVTLSSFLICLTGEVTTTNYSHDLFPPAFLLGAASVDQGCPFVHVVRKDEDIYSPILRKLFNESHHIFVGLQRIKEDVPSKNKKSQ